MNIETTHEKFLYKLMGNIAAIRNARWKAVAFTTHTAPAPVGSITFSITDKRKLKDIIIVYRHKLHRLLCMA